MGYKVKKIREKLERELGEPFSDGGWKVLCDKLYVQEVQDGIMSVETLAKEVRTLRQLQGRSEPSDAKAPAFLNGRRQRRGKVISSRQEAVSVLVAELARGRPEVQGFRESILTNQLIAWEDIGTWLDNQRPLSAHYAMIRIPVGSRPIWQGHWTLEPPLHGDVKIEKLAPLEVLPYLRPDHESVDSVPVGADGPLRQILEVSRMLSEDYGWELAQATVFLLSGCIPVVPLFRATATYNVEHTTLSRITMIVDPITNPRELAAKYGKFRRQVLNQGAGSAIRGKRLTRVRALSDKHAQLAIFSVRNCQLDSKGMAVWNRQFPQWKYVRYSNFSRDAKVAKKRLLCQMDLSFEALMNPPARQVVPTPF